MAVSGSFDDRDMKLIDLDAVAEALGVNRLTVRRWAGK